MVDDDASADARGGVNLDPGGEPIHRADDASREEAVVLPELVRDPVKPERVEPRVDEDDLPARPGGRVVRAHGRDVFPRARDDARGLAEPAERGEETSHPDLTVTTGISGTR